MSLEEVHSSLLRDRSACVRLLMALKAGRAPTEGIHYVSVGLESIVQRLNYALAEASQGKAQILWVFGEYGEGKSHLLRLMATLAQEHHFAWAYVVHDKDRHIGLHKPVWLFRGILLSLRLVYPFLNIDYSRVIYRSSTNDHYWRPKLPEELAKLAGRLNDKGWRGLVVCLDEVENCCQFHWSQYWPAWETLHHLIGDLRGPVIFCLSLTSNGLGCLEAGWSQYVDGKKPRELLKRASHEGIRMPVWSERYALPLAERIYQLHAVAFNWRPTISVEEVAQKAYKKAEEEQSKQWRAFVQAVVTILEIEHQEKEPPPVSPELLLSPPPEPSGSTPLESSMVRSSPLSGPSSASVQRGDRVEIVATSLRGLRGVVKQVKGTEAEVILVGRLEMPPVKVPLTALKKLK
ncbi:MAG: hypothetical protein D6750_08595 [Bacteroidetes bacterium]|nr:MAG: hypothetical protein D6750_08595 [Bacteroidota bacterium]